MTRRDPVIVHPEHVSYRRPPAILHPDDASLFEKEGERNIRSTVVESLRSALIVSGDSIIDTGRLRFRDDATHVHRLTNKQKLRKALDLLHPGRSLEKGVWITDNWSQGYFHWFTDALPRAIVSERVASGYPILLPDTYGSLPFVAASLELLGLKAIHFDPSCRVMVKDLLLPSHTASTGNYNRAIMQELRDRMVPKPSSKQGRRIFISRSKAARRSIVNEEEVVRVLIRSGFEIHHFEDLGLEEQIHLMNGAGTVVGLHGAGLTNMLFMPAGGRVLEIRNRNDAANNCYYSLASDLDHRYYYLLAGGNTEDTHVVDVQVDTDELERTVHAMLAQ